METPLSILLGSKGKQVYSVTPQTTVVEAVMQMNRDQIGAMAVMDKGRLVGIFTERDVLRKVIGAQLDVTTTLIQEVMSDHVLTVSPETTVGDAMKIVAEKRFRHLPVIDNDELVGLISSGDLNFWLTKNQEHKIKDLENYICGDR